MSLRRLSELLRPHFFSFQSSVPMFALPYRDCPLCIRENNILDVSYNGKKMTEMVISSLFRFCNIDRDKSNRILVMIMSAFFVLFSHSPERFIRLW
jgi:hypothetical protein